MFFVREKTTDSSLGDGTDLCHETFAWVWAWEATTAWVFLSLAGMPGPFLSGLSSFLSLFCLDIPLVTPLGADEEAPFFSFCLRAATDTYTKALCLAASISTKVKDERYASRREYETDGRKGLRYKNLHG